MSFMCNFAHYQPLYTKRVAKNKYGLSIKDSRNLKNQNENIDDVNNGNNNSNNKKLART